MLTGPRNGNPSIISIVEGKGEKRAVPCLVRRILYERLDRFDLSVKRPKIANGKPNLVKNLEKFLQYAIIERL